jgi:hypothetical protein
VGGGKKETKTNCGAKKNSGTIFFRGPSFFGFHPGRVARWGKSNLGKFWRVLQWKMLVDVIYGHLVYFTAICYTLWPFGIILWFFGIFFQFWYVVPRKIWQP